MIVRWIFFLLCVNTLYAQVKIFAPQSVVQDEAVVFELQASGEEITFPEISSIEGFPVQKAGTSNQITIVNGQKSKIVNKKFLFYPNRSVQIPSFEVIVDGKTYTTSVKEIELQKAQKTQNSQFDFKIVSDKTNVYLNEPIVVDYLFTYKKDDKIMELALGNMDFEHFWAKKIGDATTKEEGEHITQRLRYVLFAQQSGKLELKPARVIARLMDVGRSYSFFQRPSKQMSIYSNALQFEVEPLPKGVSIVGDFTIESNIDKAHIQASQAVTYTLHIKGEGNLEDLNDITLDIPNATVYSNDAKTTSSFENGKFLSTYTKNFSIVANESFTIPAVKIPYFLVNKKKVQYLTVQTYDITVDAPQGIQKTVTLEKKEKPVRELTKEISDYNGWVYFSFGVLSTVVVLFIGLFVRKKSNEKRVETPLIKSVKKAKSNSELIKILVPYVNKNTALDTLIFELEKNNNLDIKFKKKEIIKILKSDF
ncbi:BatD family protein [Candidatus Marinarcus aquaticus]|uniref:Uncharacterized protein n=1 Tax=Candidatus Marinarcus aquaticus TaxID=2044504 RepID=A0A4Q0XSS9_9BACT|nr:BatD family protein [Candidatus Marinarcus aquaticus]RXJ56275.1 hypothetical protein CRV04_09535 [Candidatus Marinarcus aquaticus]